MEELNIFGKWWLPGHQENSVAGSLEFSPSSGSELSLLDPLLLHDSAWNGVVFGRADGDDITLRNCLVSPSPFDRENEALHVLPQVTLVNQFVEHDHLFNRMEVTYPLLERWAALPLGSMDGSGDEHTFTYSPHRITAGEIEVDDMEIRLDSTRNRTAQPCKRVTISNNAMFTFETSSPASLDHFSEYIQEAQRLLSLGLNDPVHPETITAYSNNSGDRDSVSVDVRVPLSQYDNRHSPSLHHTYFTFAELDDDPGTVMSRWFADREGGSILRDLYFGTLYNDRMFEQNRLLSLVSAMESYHDLVLFPDDQVVSDNTFIPIKNGLQCLVSGTDLENRVNGLIRHVINDISIKDKIRKFMYEYESVLAGLSDDEDYDYANIIESVASSAADARHKIAHGSPEEYELVGIGGATDWLQISIEICLLNLVGVEEQRIRDQIRINYSIRVDEITLPPFNAQPTQEVE